MKILGLIPARGGSKGIPQKNRKELVGKPLIVYSIESALKSQMIDHLMVSTDDEMIRDISEKAGAIVPFLRPAELASDQSPTIDTVIHTLHFYENKSIHFDAVCLLQPTCPFRTSQEIDEAIQIFKKEDADCLISVKEVPHTYNPHWTFEIKKDSPYLNIATGEKEIISRRQELPKAYYRDGSIYLTKTKVILQNKSLYGEKISWILSSNPRHVNIDTMADWELATQFATEKK